MRLNLKHKVFFSIKLPNSDSELWVPKKLVKRNHVILLLIYSLHHFENLIKMYWYPADLLEAEV